MKTCDKLVIALTPKLACSKIKCVLTSAGMNSYDIANDVHRWKYAPKTLVVHAKAYVLVDIFLVPNVYSLTKGTSIDRETSYVNILTHWEDVSLEECKHWQEFINMFSGKMDLESDR